MQLKSSKEYQKCSLSVKRKSLWHSEFRSFFFNYHLVFSFRFLWQKNNFFNIQTRTNVLEISANIQLLYFLCRTRPFDSLFFFFLLEYSHDSAIIIEHYIRRFFNVFREYSNIKQKEYVSYIYIYMTRSLLCLRNTSFSVFPKRDF